MLFTIAEFVTAIWGHKTKAKVIATEKDSLL